MARFTQNDQEIAHLIKLEDNLPNFGFLSLKLFDGRKIEGLIRGASGGNDFKEGMNKPTAFKGDRTIEKADGTLVVIDLLDIESVVSREK